MGREFVSRRSPIADSDGEEAESFRAGFAHPGGLSVAGINRCAVNRKFRRADLICGCRLS